MPTLLVGGIEVTTLELSILKDDLTDPEQWLRDALVGKLASCKKNLDTQWRARLDGDPNTDAVPADQDNRLAMILARLDYKDYATRLAEAKI